MLGALAFAPFGLLLVAAVVVWKQATGAAWVMAGITLLAGFYFPVALLPDWIEWTSHVQPFTPAVDLLRHLLIGIPLADSAWSDVLKLAGFAAVLLPLSALGLVAAIKASRQARDDPGVLRRPGGRSRAHTRELLTAGSAFPARLSTGAFRTRR